MSTGKKLQDNWLSTANKSSYQLTVKVAFVTKGLPPMY